MIPQKPNLVTRDFSQDEWTEIVLGFSDLSLLQTWEYAEAKAQIGPWKVHRAIFMNGENLVGAVQSLVRQVPLLGRGLVWINRGPLCRRSESEKPLQRTAILEEVRRYWVDERNMYLRIALPIRDGELNPETFEASGYRRTSTSGWASALLDLSSPIEVLRSRLQQKWRNCLNKAERLGLSVSSSSGDRAFEEFLMMYKQMLSARAFDTTVTPELLSHLKSLQPERGGLSVIIAGRNGQPVSCVLMASYGEVCEYLAGASNEAGRATNAGQLLLWRAVCEAKERGYRWFDLGGIDPQLTPSGISRFKAGLGGTPYQLIGELEAYKEGVLNGFIRKRVAKVRQSVSD